MHPLAYALIAMSAVFGGVSAFVLLTRPPPPPSVIVMQVPNAGITASPESSAKAAPADSSSPNPETQGDAGADGGAKPSNVAPGSAPATSGEPAAPGASGTANVDMSGFGNHGVEGPSATGPDGAGSAPVTSTLSAGEINGVVQQNQPIIRRKCWMPALEQHAGSGPSARVNATIVIAASGAVQMVNAGGAVDDYPGLSNCIAAQIRGWKFPASGSNTPVNIPFYFAAQ